MAKKAKTAKKTPRQSTKKAARTVAKKAAMPRRKKGPTRPDRKSSKKSATKTVKKTAKTTGKKKGARATSAQSSRSRAAASTASTSTPKRRRTVKNSRSSGDFGIPAVEARDRARAGEDLMHNEAEPRTARGSVIGNRVSGAGAPDSGPGSSSGGDVDTDVIGVGTGIGIAQAGPDQLRDTGLAETDGSSDEFASGPPARGENQGPKPDRVEGSTVIPLDDDETDAI